MHAPSKYHKQGEHEHYSPNQKENCDSKALVNAIRAQPSQAVKHPSAYKGSAHCVKHVFSLCGLE